MSGHGPDQRSDDSERLQRVLRGMASPPVTPHFRDRLKDQFVSGTIRPSQRAVERPSFSLRWLPVPLVAATALAAVIFFLNRGPGYHVVDPPAGVSVVVNGETIPVDDGQAMARALKPGARIAFEGGAMMVNLVSPEHLFVQLTPGSETVLPKTPGRWFGRSARSEVTRGEVRYATGRRFRGAGMTVYTQDTRVDLVGTTLAVIQNDFGTCICLFEGAVWMGPRGGTMEILPAERRRTLYKDGRPALTEELPPDERMKLGMLRGIMDESASGKD